MLRSKRPELVRQELWGVLIAYTLLRRWMREMAHQLKVEPQRISFHTASYAIVTLLSVALPKQLAALLAQSRHSILPPRRPERSVLSVVKNRAHKRKKAAASARQKGPVRHGHTDAAFAGEDLGHPQSHQKRVFMRAPGIVQKRLTVTHRYRYSCTPRHAPVTISHCRI